MGLKMKIRGRPRDRDGMSSSSNRNSAKSARSRDHSNGSLHHSPRATNAQELESKRSALDNTPGGLETISAQCHDTILRPTSPALSKSQKTVLTETASTRKRKETMGPNADTTTIIDTLKQPPTSTLPPAKKLRSSNFQNTTESPAINLNSFPLPDTSKRRAHSAKPHTTNYSLSSTSNLPALDLHPILRSFRDELISHMQQFHHQTIQHLTSKLDQLSAENHRLKHKVDQISSFLRRPQGGSNSPTITTSKPLFATTPHPHPHPSTLHQNEEHHPNEKAEDYMSCENESNYSPEPSRIRPAYRDQSDTEANTVRSSRLRNTEDPTSQEDLHFDWMKKRFKDCFGLPTEMYKRRTLFSFDGVELAKGYRRVVATWQGLYYELKDQDINFSGLHQDFNTAWGKSTLTTKGVTIFKLSRRDTRTNPRPHRFAVVRKGNPTTPCNPLKVGCWYVHVYQTKININGVLKTLNSKAIAKELKEKWGLQYLPRASDIEQTPNQQPNLNTDPRRQQIPNQPEFLPTHSSNNQNTRRSNVQQIPPGNNSSTALYPRPLTNIPTATAGLNTITPSHFPLASNPPPYTYNPSTSPWTPQKPYYLPYAQQYQQQSPYQLIQTQPSGNFQPAQDYQHYTSTQAYNSNLQPTAINPNAQNYGLAQWCNTNFVQAPSRTRPNG